MNWHQIKGELKRSLKGLIIWTSVVLLFTLMCMSFYPSMAEVGEDLTRLLENLPAGLLQALGMDDSMMSSALGFYKVYYGTYIIVIMGIYLMSSGAGIFAKEESQQTIEFIMSKPISRMTYFYSKVATAFILFLGIVLTQAVFAGITMAIVDKNPFDFHTFFVFHFNGSLLLLFFLSVGIIISMLVNPRINFMGLAFGVVFGSYFIEALAQGIKDMDWMGRISPFHYADFNISQSNYSVDYLLVLLTLIIVAGLIFWASKRFEKRDFLTL